jgi:hypothetical protein
MSTIRFEKIDQDKMTSDFAYFLEVYNLVEDGFKLPDEIRKKYYEGFHKFFSRLPVSNQPIPDWNPDVMPPSQGIKGMIERFATIFA